MSVLLNDPAVARVGSYTGQSGTSSNQARIFIALKPHAERGLDTDHVIARLRRATREVQGVALYMVPVQELRVGGRISKAQYQYTITGRDLGELEIWAGRLVERLNDFPDLRDVTTDLEVGALQAMLVIDRDAAARLQVAPNDIDQTLYDAFGQRLVSSIYAPHYTYHVVLEAAPELQEDPSSLAKLYVAGPGGKQVPLGNVVRIEHGVQMSAVAHQGQSPGGDAHVLDAARPTHPAGYRDRRARGPRTRPAKPYPGQFSRQCTSIHGLTRHAARADRRGAFSPCT